MISIHGDAVFISAQIFLTTADEPYGTHTQNRHASWSRRRPNRGERMQARSVAGIPGLLVTAFSVLLNGCGGLPSAPRDREASTFDAVGTIDTAIVSVVPFEAVVQNLQPNFELKPEEALAQAIAVTSTADSQIDRSLKAT